MPRGKRGRTRARLADVFLNIPYDKKFERLYLAFIAGVSSLGLVPRTTLEIPGGQRRLDRIWDLLRSCQYSVHDLSRVEIDRKPPVTPRFNMPFELGLAVAWERVRSGKHHWFVFETMQRRAEKSLSDVSGTDIHVHDGRVQGVFRELCNAFVRRKRRPSVGQIWSVYRDLRRNLPRIMERAGARSLFEARVFRDLCVVASASADKHVS